MLRPFPVLTKRFGGTARCCVSSRLSYSFYHRVNAIFEPQLFSTRLRFSSQVGQIQSQSTHRSSEPRFPQHSSLNATTTPEAMVKALKIKDRKAIWQVFLTVKEKQLERSISPEHYSKLLVLLSYSHSKGRIMIETMENNGIQFNTPLQYISLISFYEKHGEVKKADELLQELKRGGLRFNTHAYNTLIDLVGTNKPYRAFEIFQARTKATNDFVPNRATFHILLRLCKRHNFGDLVTKIYSSMQESGLEPSLMTYNILIDAYTKLADFEKADQTYREMETKGISPDMFTFSILLNGYAARKDWNSAVKLYGKMSAQKLVPDTVVFNSLINVLTKSKQIDRALALYQDMLRLKVRPTVITFSLLINGYLRARQNQKARDIVNDMLDLKIQPDHVLYNSLIHGFGQSEDLESVFRLVEDMKSHGLSPDVVTYSSIIRCYIRNGKVEKALNTYKDMLKTGVRPDTVIYSILLDAFGKQKNIERVEELHQAMLSNRVPLNSIIYSTLIQTYSRCSSLERAVSLYEEMRKRHIQPDTVVYTNLIQSFGEHSQMDQAFAIFQDMMESAIKPSLVTFNVLIDICAKHSDVHRAHKYFEEMKKHRIQPDVVSYNSLLNAYVKNRDLAKAQCIFNEMTKSRLNTAISYNTLMHGYAMKEDYERSLTLHQEMIAKNIAANSHTYSIIMYCYSQMGKGPEVLDLWKTVKTCPFPKDTFNSTISVLLDSCGYNNDLRTLQSTWQSLKYERFLLDENNFNSYIEALCRHEAICEAIRVFTEEMPLMQVKPSVKTCRTLLTPLHHRKRTPEIQQVYQHLKTHFPQLYAEFLRESKIVQ